MERIYKIEKPYERTLWSEEKLEEYVQEQGEKIDPRDVRRLQLWKERTEITMEDLEELRNLKVINTDFNKTLVLEANNVLDLHNISAHFGGINREVVWDRLAQLIYGVTPYAWADGIAAIQELRKYFFYKIAPYMTPQEFERIAQGSFDRFIERKCCKPYFLIMKRTGRAVYMPNSIYADETADLCR
uniref:SECA_MOTOR_DEAD domain-containing protein n=1 Tax=Strongyloides papillosus TaxID=174720 RepID=A0A0N5BI88_STREA